MESSLVSDILEQLDPAAAVETDLYVVPNTMTARLYGFTVANRSAAPREFRFSLSPQGVATANAHYVYYDLPVPGNYTFMVQMDVTLRAGDTIRVYSTLGDLTFILYGQQT